MTRQQIIDAVMEWTEKLGHVPSHVELLKYAGVSRKTVRRHFANYRAVLAECNLAGTGSGYKAELAEVFRDWAQVARALGKLPSIAEYTLKGRFSVRPLVLRFGSWGAAPFGLKQYAEEQGWAEEWKDVLAMVEARTKQEEARRAMKSVKGPQSVREARKAAAEHWPESLKPKKELYGRMLRPGPMLCAPTNEQGVLLLFGAMAEKLGFAVLKVRAAYPDCEAFRVVDGELMELLKIELEHESRNFLLHMHDRKDCDMIVCWKHNWPECPLEVVELGRYF